MSQNRSTIRQHVALAWSMLDVRYGAIGLVVASLAQLASSVAFSRFATSSSPVLLTVLGTVYSLASVIFHGMIGAFVFFLVVVLLPRLYKHYKNVESARDDVETLRNNARCFREDTGTILVEDSDPLVDAYIEDGLYDDKLPIRTTYHVQSAKRHAPRPVHETLREMAMIAQQKCAAIKSVMGPENADLLKSLNDVEYSSFRVLHTDKQDISYPRLIQHIERMVQAFDKAANP